MKATILLAVLFVGTSLSFAITQPTWRCGDNIIQVGDYASTVVLKCGEPFMIEKIGTNQQASSSTSGTIYPMAWGVAGGGQSYKATSILASSSTGVERWVYKFGSGLFMGLFTFDGSRLVKIETGERQ